MKKLAFFVLAVTLIAISAVPVSAATGSTGTATVQNAPPTIDCDSFTVTVAGPTSNPGMKWSNQDSSLARGNNPYTFTGETFNVSIMASDPNGDVDLENGLAKLYVDYDPYYVTPDFVMEYEMGSVPNSGNQVETMFRCTDIPVLGGTAATFGPVIDWHIELSVVVWDSMGAIMYYNTSSVRDYCEESMMLNPTFGITTPQNVTFNSGMPGTEQSGTAPVSIMAISAFNPTNTPPAGPSGCVLVNLDMQVSDMTVAGGGNVIPGYAMEAKVTAQGGTAPTAVGNYVGGGEAGYLAPAPGGGLPTMSQAQLTSSLPHGSSVALAFSIDLPNPIAPATYNGNIYYYVSAQ